MDDQAWTASASDLLEIRFLEWVASYEPSGLIPGAMAFYPDEDAVTPDEREALVSVVKDLRDRGLVDGNTRLGGSSTFGAMLTPAGRRLLGDRQERRGSRRARSIAARDALLDWLYESSDGAGSTAEIEQFAGSVRAHVEGDPFATTRSPGRLSSWSMRTT